MVQFLRLWQILVMARLVHRRDRSMIGMVAPEMYIHRVRGDRVGPHFLPTGLLLLALLAFIFY